jgi:hypothetical protein
MSEAGLGVCPAPSPGGFFTTTGDERESRFRASARQKAKSCRTLAPIIVPIRVPVKCTHTTTT